MADGENSSGARGTWRSWRSTIWRGVLLGFGGCVVMPVLLVVAVNTLIMLIGGEH